MREVRELLVKKINELLENGTVNRVIGWKAGDFCYDVTPAVYTKEDNLDDFLFDGFCGANQSKYLINETKEGAQYNYTLLGMTEGKNLLQIDDEGNTLEKDAFYAVVKAM